MPENETDLIKSSILDTLAVKNQELAEVKRLEQEKARIANRKLRDKNIVILYLCARFPLAASMEGLPEISEKEFPKILKMARGYYLGKLGIAGIAALPFIGASVASLVVSVMKGAMIAPDPSGLPYFLGGVMMSILFGAISGFWISRTAKYMRILTRG